MEAVEIEVKARPVLPKYSAASVARRKIRLEKKLKTKSYSERLRLAVSMKWDSPEIKEWWYMLHSAARKRKAIKLHTQQGGKCIYCERETWLFESDRNGLSSRRLATLDHVVPQSEGGTDNLRNLVMACSACNSIRGSMGFEKFKHLRTDADRWASYCKTIARLKTKKPKELTSKKLDKRNQFVLNIALLLYYFPKHGAYLKQMVQEVMDKIEAARLARLENSAIDPADIAT